MQIKAPSQTHAAAAALTPLHTVRICIYVYRRGVSRMLLFPRALIVPRRARQRDRRAKERLKKQKADTSQEVRAREEVCEVRWADEIKRGGG